MGYFWQAHLQLLVEQRLLCVARSGQKGCPEPAKRGLILWAAQDTIWVSPCGMQLAEAHSNAQLRTAWYNHRPHPACGLLSVPLARNMASQLPTPATARPAKAKSCTVVRTSLWKGIYPGTFHLTYSKYLRYDKTNLISEATISMDWKGSTDQL